MKCEIYKGKEGGKKASDANRKGTIATVVYLGEMSVLYTYEFRPDLENITDIVALGLDYENHLCMSRHEFDNVYEYVCTMEVE